MTAPSVGTYRRLSDAGLSTTIQGLMDELEAATGEAARRQSPGWSRNDHLARAPESERLKRRHRRRRVDSLGRVWRGHLYLAHSAESGAS